LASESGESARALLIKTRHGTAIDKSLLLAACQECREILQAASEAVGDDVFELVRRDRRHVEEDLRLSNPYYDMYFRFIGNRELVVRDALDTLREELLKYRLPEEEKAWELAHEARESARMCGCCGKELSTREPAYLGAEVYVGMQYLPRNRSRKPLICEPGYERTVLCKSCAPEWLSAERDDMVTQLCAHCERPMVSRLDLSALKNTFCSNACEKDYKDQLREEQRAEARKKVCEVCGEEFIPTRKGAKTCSKKCKQKAYRQRKREVKDR
jgi:hypothetical protein